MYVCMYVCMYVPVFFSFLTLVEITIEILLRPHTKRFGSSVGIPTHSQHIYLSNSTPVLTRDTVLSAYYLAWYHARSTTHK